MIIYTFKTFPWIEEIEKLGYEVLVLQKLKQDLAILCDRISDGETNLILGIGNTNTKSRLETLAVNKFNNGKVEKSGPTSYQLPTPGFLRDHFPVSSELTTSFCNWTAYKLSYYLEESNLNLQVAFLHIKDSAGVEKLIESLKLYEKANLR